MATANVPYDLDRFLASVLRGLGMEPTEWRMNMMREWAAGEGTGAGYNPLATTQQGLEDPEDPYWNDNGGNPVKNYRDFDSGVAQTVRTLKNGYYDKILASFQNEAIVPGAGNEARTWGTVHFRRRAGAELIPGIRQASPQTSSSSRSPRRSTARSTPGRRRFSVKSGIRTSRRFARTPTRRWSMSTSGSTRS